MKRLVPLVYSFSFRKKKLLEVMNWSPDKSLLRLCLASDKYIETCRRFCRVFGTTKFSAMALKCLKCQQLCCDLDCIGDRDEMIIFDFGSKTTWFKYCSDCTGQLSMHPTVGPLSTCSSSCKASAATLEKQLCPICEQMMFKMCSAEGPLPSGGSDSGFEGSVPWQANRLSKAFSRLSCFSASGDIDDGLTLLPEATDIPSLPEQSCCISPDISHSRQAVQLCCGDVDSEQFCGSLESAHSCHGTEPEQSCDDTEQEQFPDYTSSACCSGKQPVKFCGNACPQDRIITYLFLVKHMLKRNPFFQLHQVPFVICEPTDCDNRLKEALAELLLCHTKAPGSVLWWFLWWYHIFCDDFIKISNY